MSSEVHDARLIQVGYDKLTVTSSAVKTLTSSQYANATHAVIQTDQNIRYMLDHAGGSLATDKGMKHTATSADLTIPAKDFSLFGMIAESTSATVEIMYLQVKA